MCLMLFLRKSLGRRDVIVEERCDVRGCVDSAFPRAYERAEAVTVGVKANTSIYNLYWDLLHCAPVPTTYTI